MPDAYGIYEGRYLNYGTDVSAADAVNVNSSLIVPANVVRTILAASYLPSVAETRSVYWFIAIGSTIYAVTAPQSIALGGNMRYPMVREGMEFKLFPGEFFGIFRDVATAGSTMSIFYRYIDSPLPIYEQYDPQVRRAQIRRFSSGQKISAGGGVGMPGGSGVLGPGSLPGEGGGGEPVV